MLARFRDALAATAIRSLGNIPPLEVPYGVRRNSPAILPVRLPITRPGCGIRWRPDGGGFDRDAFSARDCMAVEATRVPARSETFPLTFGQEQHYRTLALQPQLRTALYTSYQVRGPLDAAAFVAALGDVVRRHDALRIAIDSSGPVPLQTLREAPPTHELVSLQAVRAASEEQFTRYARTLMRRDLLAPWDLASEYPFRFRLLRFSPGLHAFLVTLSHLVLDDRSLGILLRDLWSSYRARLEGRPEPPVAPARFLPAAKRQRARFDAKAATTSRAYWESRMLATAPTCQFFPELMEGPVDVHRFEPVVLVLDARGRAQLEQVCLDAGCTGFQFLLAGLASAIFASSPQDRVAVYVPIDGRESGEADVAGMFVASLPVVIDRAPSFERLVATVRSALLRALAHRHVGDTVLRSCEARLAQLWGQDYRRIVTATYVERDGGAGDPIPGLDVRREAYSPGVRRSAQGVALQARAHADGITVFLSTGDPLPTALARTLAAPLAEVLRSRGVPVEVVGGGGPIPRIRAGGRDTLLPLRGPDGRAVLWVDPEGVARHLVAHERVLAAGVAVRHAEGQVSRLVATVAAEARLPVDELRRHCLAGAEASRCLPAPSHFDLTVSPADRPGLAR